MSERVVVEHRMYPQSYVLYTLNGYIVEIGYLVNDVPLYPQIKLRWSDSFYNIDSRQLPHYCYALRPHVGGRG